MTSTFVQIIQVIKHISDADRKMAVVRKACYQLTLCLKVKYSPQSSIIKRWSNTLTNTLVEKHRTSELSSSKEREETQDVDESVPVPTDFLSKYPDFIPDRSIRWKKDRVKEALERRDMFRRRKHINMPEFYVGSILAVSSADVYAPNKVNRFVGICIERWGSGLSSSFTLRNVIDGQGVEITYHQYNPTIQSIAVLKLEKRPDEHLRYLRNAPHVYSTVPFDMNPVPTARGKSVPVNTEKVPLNPKPWKERWERQELLGAEFEVKLRPKQQKKFDAAMIPRQLDKYDLMKKYRTSTSKRERESISKEIYRHEANKEIYKHESEIS